MTFDSHKKKIVLLSDLHNNIEKFNKIIQHESADINICLGDWFDSFYLDDSDDKLIVAQATITKLIVENFVLNLKLESKNRKH